MKGEKQPSDTKIYKDVAFNQKISHDLVGPSSKFFLSLKSKGCILIRSSWIISRINIKKPPILSLV